MRNLNAIRAVSVVLACLLLAPSAGAAEYLLLHPGAPGSLYDLSATEFARRVNARLPQGDRLVPISEPGGDGARFLSAVRDGRASVALVSSGMLEVSGRFAIFELPYLIRERAQIRAIRPALMDRFLQPAAEKAGLKIVGLWENGFRHMTNDLRPVTQPAQLKGMRIALAGNGWRERLFNAFGAQAVPMAAIEIANTVRDHRADGREGPLNEIAASGVAAAQHQLILSDHLYSPAFLIADRNKLSALPAALREAVVAEGLAIELWIQKTAIDLDNRLIDDLGLSMVVSHADVTAFRAASQNLYGDFVRTVPEGMAMLEALQSESAVTGATTNAR